MQSRLDFGQVDHQAGDAPSLNTWPPQTQSLHADWQPIWKAFADSAQGRSLIERITAAVAAGVRMYPPDPLRVFRMLALRDVRVVILGQDPYHGPGQAEGLAFSVPERVPIPPSLRNIFKEVQRDAPGFVPASGHLGRWVSQGVLLLNTVLTVQENQPASHARWGWEGLTDAVITTAAQSHRPVVFVLWGAHAQAKRQLIMEADAQGRHLVLQSNHPSPLSAMRPPVPFLGCGHFAQANEFWRQLGVKPLEW